MKMLETTLLLSILLQATAAVLALRLIKIAGGRTAWVLISLAVGAMAVRRGITLANIWWADQPLDPQSADLAAEMVALCTSALLLAGIAAIAPQVAAMKRAERELRENKETLDALLDASPVGLGLVRKGRMVWANQPMLAMFEYEPTQWTDQPVQVFFSNQDYFQETNRKINQSLKSAGRASIDCRLVTRSGKIFDSYVQGRPLDRDQPSKGIIFAVTDITERKKAQNALSESQAKYRLVVDNANDAIFILQDDKIQFPNRRGAEILGHSLEELEDMPYLAMVHPEDQQAVLKGLYEAVNAGQHLASHQHRVNVLGQVRWMDINAVPISWQGKAALLCFVRDLSSQKKLERQFLQAQKMEALGRLAGGVAHDFNNLLQVIGGYSELISRQVTPDNPSYEHVANVIESARRASRLTGQLLTFSREHLIEMQELDLNELVTGLEKMLRRIIGEDIVLETRLGSGLGRIMADTGRVEQVIMNLAVNARDAMPHGGKLNIETELVILKPGEDQRELELEPGEYNLLTIMDTGCGMSQEVMSHLFEPFFTTKEGGKGTGLGLSTVYGIVKAAKGNVLVDSELGEGSQFRIYLPSSRQRRQPQPIHKVTPAKLLTGSETVLLVEDEEQVRKLLAETLRLNGYQVITAANGEEALELLESLEGKVHLLITDVVMPKMSGPQLVQHIKKTRPHTKVLFMSGYTDRSEILPNGMANGSHFIRKPFTVESLGQMVRKVLCAPGG